MPLALHFDPYAGISAASALGALLDTGLSLDRLRAELAKLDLDGWAITAERATVGVTGTRVTITVTGGPVPWTLGRVRALLAASTLSDGVRGQSLRALQHLAAATGGGTPRDDDPAGTLDTILAVIGVIAGLELLDVTEISTTAPPRGVAGSPVTPAAAALLATVATERPASLRLRQVGYGLGPVDPAGPHPAAVRVWLGEAERGATNWQTVIAPATINDGVAGALVLVLDRADEAGPEYERLTALAAAWSGLPARLSAVTGARDSQGLLRVTAAIEAAVNDGARRIILQRLGLATDPAIEDSLVGIIRWARGRWRDLQIVPAQPLLTGKQLAYRLAGRATEARDAAIAGAGGDGSSFPDLAETALLLIAEGNAEAEANAEAYRLARLIWEGRDWRTVEVAFASGASPTIAAGLARCQQLGAQATIALPLLALEGPAYDRLSAALDEARATIPGQRCVIGRPPGTVEGFAAIAWERYREASGFPIGDAAHGHSHGVDGSHSGLVAVRPILPPRYQGNATVNSAPMDGAADLVYDDQGQVVWDDIWGAFCDLAIAGGPPHRGALLEAPQRDEVQANPVAYEHVLDELARGLKQITGWPIVRDAAPGWIGLVCPDEDATVWILRAVLVENVTARREGITLFLPAGPTFRLKYEIKNVITAVAKTHHYWTEHMAALAGEDLAAPAASPLAEPSEPPIVGTDPSVTERGKRRYEYECRACATRFDLARSVEEAGQPLPCPFCGAPARRVFSTPQLLFKADPRDSHPVWHNHGGYGHAHAKGKGFHGAGRSAENGRGE
ncbi:MAG TPA: nickel insertion protein [Thermomicrobiales bacterium]|jgi:sirohydrochlorin cobaltochelatase